MINRTSSALTKEAKMRTQAERCANANANAIEQNLAAHEENKKRCLGTCSEFGTPLGSIEPKCDLPSQRQREATTTAQQPNILERNEREREIHSTYLSIFRLFLNSMCVISDIYILDLGLEYSSWLIRIRYCAIRA